MATNKDLLNVGWIVGLLPAQKIGSLIPVRIKPESRKLIHVFVILLYQHIHILFVFCLFDGV